MTDRPTPINDRVTCLPPTFSLADTLLAVPWLEVEALREISRAVRQYLFAYSAIEATIGYHGPLHSWLLISFTRLVRAVEALERLDEPAGLTVEAV